LTEDSRPIKEKITCEIKKAYKENRQLPAVDPQLLVKNTEHDEIFHENEYFCPVPGSRRNPIRLPTTTPVPVFVIEMLKQVMCDKRTTRSITYTHNSEGCHILDKAPTSSYTFVVDKKQYTFSDLLLDEMSILNIHPSEQFVEAMKKYITLATNN
jgi:hypothetical protein